MPYFFIKYQPSKIAQFNVLRKYLYKVPQIFDATENINI